MTVFGFASFDGSASFNDGIIFAGIEATGSYLGLSTRAMIDMGAYVSSGVAYFYNRVVGIGRAI